MWKRILLLLVLFAPADLRAHELFREGLSKGFVLGLHAKSDDYTYEKELRQIAEMGARRILIVVSGYQDDVTSTEIALTNDGVPSRERVIDDGRELVVV